MEKILWSHEFEKNINYLLELSDISERAWIEDNSIRIDGIDLEPELLQEKVSKFLKETDNEDIPQVIHNTDDLELILQELGFEGFEISWVEEYPVQEEQLVYCTYNHEFYNLQDTETIKVYEYWDGSNLKRIVLSETMVETEVVVRDYINFDEWDGSNWVTGSIGHHEVLYIVVSVNGQNVTDTYLLREWSQWQGDIDTGKLLYAKETVRTHLESIGRDVEEYMQKIEQLEKEITEPTS